MKGRGTSNSKTQKQAGKANGLGTNLGSRPHETYWAPGCSYL